MPAVIVWLDQGCPGLDHLDPEAVDGAWFGGVDESGDLGTLHDEHHLLSGGDRPGIGKS
ncbi:hypothetical protein [Actinoplanes derwentensis]|uniref:hypothetical protein n=1 Tax=Actinoplanes derwentensis TaxID=113562 RepID=UPI0012FD1B98|nr:hypothetical protein [Actinoplanes derwentensis]GID86409.1 hypothetical protein Ade03nite_53330 [Actinoplanes derwentensis]